MDNGVVGVPKNFGHMQEEPAFLSQMAVLGLGLMGGSFAMAAREAGLARFIVGFDPDRDALTEAVTAGVIEQAASDVRDAVTDAQLVVLAAPVRAILELLDRIVPHVQPGTLVLDLGSTKREIVDRMGALPEDVRAVGGHPMCGKEVAGLEHAEADLFREATFALCPTLHTDDAARQEAADVATALGAHPLWLEADEHDRLVAAVSHLPYLLSVVLVQSAFDGNDRRAWQLAASGFRDTSRLAASDVQMMLDVLRTNRDAVTANLERAEEHLRQLRTLLAGDDEVSLTDLLGEAARLRSEWNSRRASRNQASEP